MSEARSPRRSRVPLALLSLLFLATAVSLWWQRSQALAPPVYDPVPAFSLIRHDGQPLRRDDLKGHPWVADFIFTTCSGICPAMTQRMSRLRREGPDGARYVSFTVDPATDTTEVLARYARPFDPRGDWSFVTGARDALHGLARDGFKLDVFETPSGQASPDGPFMHSGRFVLVDGDARIRGYYDSADEQDMARLLADLRHLAR